MVQRSSALLGSVFGAMMTDNAQIWREIVDETLSDSFGYLAARCNGAVKWSGIK